MVIKDFVKDVTAFANDDVEAIKAIALYNKGAAPFEDTLKYIIALYEKKKN